MSYQRTNWKGVPESNAIYKGLMNLEDGVEKIYKKNETQLNSTGILSVTYERTAAGLKCKTRFAVPDDMFLCMFVQAHYDEPSADRRHVFLAYVHVPEAFKNKYDLHMLIVKSAETPYELTTENAQTMSKSSISYDLNANRWNVTTKLITGMAVDELRMFRLALRLFDDAGNVIRTIYSSQFNIVKTDSNNLEISEVYYKTDSDVISNGGFYRYRDNFILSNANDHGTSTVKVSDFYDGLYYPSGVFSGMNEWHTLIPWSLNDEGRTIIFPMIRIGESGFIFGESCSFVSPDMVAKAAITSGQTFMLDGLWYTATANIGSGETVVLGTNAVACEMPVF